MTAVILVSRSLALALRFHSHATSVRKYSFSRLRRADAIGSEPLASRTSSAAKLARASSPDLGNLLRGGVPRADAQ